MAEIINFRGALELVFRSERLFEHGPKSMNARIVLANYISDDEGSPMLTEDCESFELLEAQLNRLKGQLKTILEQARRRFEGEEPN